MASKSSAPRRILDLKAREDAYGSIYAWLWRRRVRLSSQLDAGVPDLWYAAAATMAKDGVRSISGASPTRNAVWHSWQKVAKHMGEEAVRRSAAQAADRPPAISRKKGWVPAARDPLPPAKPPVSPPQARSVLEPGTPAHNPPTTAITPPVHVPHPMTVAKVHLTGDDPLANLTAEEAVALEQFKDSPRNARLSMLRTIRKISHLDRHNKS